MRKIILATIASAGLLAFSSFSPLAADSPSQASAEANIEHINSVQALNYAAMSVYRVKKIPSKVTVTEEYAAIINNIAFGNIEDDPNLMNLINSMMDAYTEERLNETDLNLIRRQYDAQVNQAFLKVKPLKHIRTEVAINSAGKMVTAMRADGFWAKLGASAAVAGSAFMEYNLALQENERMSMQARAEEREFMQLRMTAEWQLAKEKIRRFNDLQKNLINAAWRLWRRHNLPDRYRLTEENIAAYFNFIKEKDSAKALRQGARLKESLAAYPPFWLYYGMAAHRAGKYDLARECYENCEKFAGSMLRKNHFLASMARYKIFVLGEREGDEAKRLLELIERHSAADDWNNITFAALQWYQLGDKGKADTLLLQNIDDGFNVPLHTELRRQLAADRLDLASVQGAVQGMAIREFREPNKLDNGVADQKKLNSFDDGQFDLGDQYFKNINQYGELTLIEEQLEIHGQFAMGNQYFEGRVLDKNPAKAVEWWSKAAARGHASAQFNLGKCYALGMGVAKDSAKAVEWYKKAAAQGHEGAKKALQRMGAR